MKILFENQRMRKTIAMCLAILLAFMDPSVVQAMESSVQVNTATTEDMGISEIPVVQEDSVSSGDAGRGENTDMPGISEKDPDIPEENPDIPTIVQEICCP